MKKRNLNTCTIEEKSEALKRLRAGESKKKLAQEFGVRASTIRDWEKQESSLLQFGSSNFSEFTINGRKTLQNSAHPQVSESTFLWFLQMRNSGVPISGAIIEAQACKFSKLLNINNFSASKGWLDRWLKRYGIRHLKITREKLSADLEAAGKKIVNKFPELVRGFQPQQIYSADKSGLVIKLLLNKTYAAATEKNAAGFKKK